MKPDWDKIEAEYRIGQKTLRELADEYRISHSAIARHMKRHGIERDLTDQVRAAAKAEVIRAEVTKAQQNVTKTPAEMVQAAGVVAAVIEMKQRGRLQKLAELAQQLAKEPELPDGATPLEKEQALARRLVVLTEVEAKLTPLERKVYRLDDEAGGEKSFEAWIAARG